MKKLVFLYFFLFSAVSALASSYVVVGISGFGTRRPENAWQPSGAHENLPHGDVHRRFELVHYAKKRELKEVISEFRCKNGEQLERDLKLMIMVNSWGSGKGISLSKMYKKQCGQEVDLFVMVDGFKKPFLPQGRSPKAKRCINFYQTKGLIRGKKIKNCENYDLTDELCPKGVGGINCHIRTEWAGTKRGASLMKKLIEKEYEK